MPIKVTTSAFRVTKKEHFLSSECSGKVSSCVFSGNRRSEAGRVGFRTEGGRGPLET